MPPGFDFDYVNLDALEDRFTVVDGDLVAGTARYRLLYLGGSSGRMTVRALRRIAALVEAGATVVGRRPAGVPSLADDDGEHERLCDLLWTGAGARGRVLDTADLAAALARARPGSRARPSRAPTCSGSAGGSRPTRSSSWPIRGRSR